MANGTKLFAGGLMAMLILGYPVVQALGKPVASADAEAPTPTPTMTPAPAPAPAPKAHRAKGVASMPPEGRLVAPKSQPNAGDDGAKGPDTARGATAAEGRAPDPKTADAKPSEPKLSDAKLSDAKLSDAKPSETRLSETKMPAPKSADSAPPAKGSDAKSPDSKVEAVKASAAVDETQIGVRKYCLNIAAAATDARFAWQSKKLLELETRIKLRIADLDAKQAELKGWYDKREAINKQARDSLVGIYAKMKPETAAAQIAALDDDMATAVLAALTPRQASAIFNEITPSDRAAKLAGLLANPSASANDKKL